MSYNKFYKNPISAHDAKTLSYVRLFFFIISFKLIKSSARSTKYLTLSTLREASPIVSRIVPFLYPAVHVILFFESNFLSFAFFNYLIALSGQDRKLRRR